MSDPRGTTVLGLETSVVLGIIGSIVSSVGIVIANKYLVAALSFNYVIILSAIHFFATALGMWVLRTVSFFEHKKADMMEVIKASIATAASVGFMNLNLTYNSVGFYQMTKLLCVPAILVLQYYIDGSTVSRNVKLSLLMVLVGVGIATEADVSVNPQGLIMASLAVFSTAVAQIWTGQKQKELQLNPSQLLELSAPYVGLTLTIMSPLLDSWYSLPATATRKAVVGLVDYVWSSQVVLLIIFTCLCAVGVNLTNFIIIGKTSPLTYQVIGHAKTCLVLLLGVWLFGNQLKPRGVLGVLVALVATIIYTEVKRRESLASRGTPAAVSASSTSATPTKYTAHPIEGSRTQELPVASTKIDDSDLDIQVVQPEKAH